MERKMTPPTRLPATPLDRLGARVAEAQDRSLSLAEGADLARARARLLAHELPVRRRRVPLALALVATLVAAVIGFVVLRKAPALTFAVGGAPGNVGAFVAASVDAPLAIRFSDGSSMVLTPSSQGRVLEVDAHGAKVVLERGKADVSVVHRDYARWDVIAGPFDVHVTGTQFALSWSPTDEELVVTMQEGSVLVSGGLAQTGRAVVAGETLRVWSKSGRLELARTSDLSTSTSAPPPAPTIAGPPAPSPVLPPVLAVAVGSVDDTVAKPKLVAPLDTANTAKPTASEEDWRLLAASAKYPAALAAAEKEGFSGLCDLGSASDVLMLGDIARFAGSGVRAREAYLAVRRRFPGVSAASSAAFALGRLSFDQSKAYAEAATWFDTCLREAPAGSYAREALGRLMEARQRSGDAEGAKAAAQRYLGLYPEGPHAALARSLTS